MISLFFADQNRNKNVNSKTVNSLKSSEAEHEKGVKAAEEISRLEALCESRTKELTFLKMQLKSSVTAFDAMSALVNYLTQEVSHLSLSLFSGFETYMYILKCDPLWLNIKSKC